MTAFKNMKYLEINLTKYVQEPHTENRKTLLTESEDLHKWKGVPWSCIRRLNCVTTATVSK